MQQPSSAMRLVRLPLLVSLVFLALILNACHATQTTAVSSAAGTDIVAKPAEVNLGRVPFDQQTHARFTLVNRGTSQVHLDPNVEVQTLEGC